MNVGTAPIESWMLCRKTESEARDFSAHMFHEAMQRSNDFAHGSPQVARADLHVGP